MTPRAVIAITGGIGAGKSVVSHILRTMRLPVYNSDSEARTLMENDPGMHEQLRLHIHPQAVTEAGIDRALISSIVFADPGALSRLNGIVHPRVAVHFAQWTARTHSPVAFIETAILHRCAPLHKLVSAEWHVTAPADIRIARVMKRNGMTRDQVAARIRAQGPLPPVPGIPRTILLNDGVTPLLPACLKALETALKG